MGDTKRGRERAGQNKQQDVLREDIQRAKELIAEGREEEVDLYEELAAELEAEHEAEELEAEELEAEEFELETDLEAGELEIEEVVETDLDADEST